jgi:hypothetical protein
VKNLWDRRKVHPMMRSKPISKAPQLERNWAGGENREKKKLINREILSFLDRKQLCRKCTEFLQEERISLKKRESLRNFLFLPLYFLPFLSN